jgi:hypothetical protein
MRSEVLIRLERIARGEIVPKSGVTGVTGVTRPNCYTQKPASLHALPLLHPETGKARTSHTSSVTARVTAEPLDAFDPAERAAIAVVDANVPPAYAGAWAAFQIRNPPHVSAAEWYRAVDDAGRFLDEWAGLALDFGWQPNDIFGPDGLAWFCGGERIWALGPHNAVTTDGRAFTRTTVNLVGRRGADSRSDPSPGR